MDYNKIKKMNMNVCILSICATIEALRRDYITNVSKTSSVSEEDIISRLDNLENIIKNEWEKQK